MCSRDVVNGVKALQKSVEVLEERLTKLEKRIANVEGKSQKTSASLDKIRNEIKSGLDFASK